MTVFTGTYRLKQLTRSGSKVLADGQVSGNMLGHKVNTAVTRTPVALTPQTGAASPAAAAAPAIACPILNLVLGPLHLNLLGS
jgi:hypothetical protein